MTYKWDFEELEKLLEPVFASAPKNHKGKGPPTKILMSEGCVELHDETGPYLFCTEEVFNILNKIGQ